MTWSIHPFNRSGNRNVVHGRANHNRVGSQQLFHQGVRKRERVFLRRAEAGWVRVRGERPLIRDEREVGCRQVGFYHFSLRVFFLPGFDKSGSELPRDEVAACAGIYAK
jgi:hypothetical protein